MKRYFLSFLLLLVVACNTINTEEEQEFTTFFENSGGKETPAYTGVMEYYMKLARTFPDINLQTMGKTDSGHPLHIVTYNPKGNFNFEKIRKDKRILLINNGIHPGESDGIDATMMLFRDYATGKLTPPENTVIVAIPVYNIGGALNRNSHTRANQNGPEEYGFRGNARNYDLNRDFIKADSKNARAFAEIFHLVKPDVFVDTHVSNGADYQYTLTHLFTQHNKLGGELGKYLHQEMMPQLEKALASKEWYITPYVNVFNEVPEKGFSQFMDHPRYSTGYTTLWNTLGMMVETHMLKPYKQRVEGTYALLKNMVDITEKDYRRIGELREQAFKNHATAKTYPVQWTVDSTKLSTLHFRGYEADTLISAVTGFPRLKYDRNRPFTKPVSYNDYFKPSKEVTIPEAYIIPKQWWHVIARLQSNNVTLNIIPRDTLMEVECYRIEDYKTQRNAYEGHYPHYNTRVSAEVRKVQFHKGDLIVKTDQPALRYLLETLEPEATDSFFNWNFFDAILQQKEHFSPYVFEDIAREILNTDPALKEKFEARKKEDTLFAGNWYKQLDWVYKHSPYYEKAHLQYPVYRVGS
ncbi:M14 family metallopeptidase [Sinomicrobium weinanense]|uniref:M14 family metallopeptidase n=1 Tax=Sinomicrobium weinanense TaxID=2842200 RepID=A0A926Q2P9_9FLAO|nr:M14 family metallopeptidase [Sinomicrobium weinanense]MBC9796074.1 M14 family metallopeptidase [Sinomicrobium weinanense]MBU3124743.1 M14 family metallopeptidase [Sinomicrobium weinanense]